jgi:hypothetical protein
MLLGRGRRGAERAGTGPAVRSVYRRAGGVFALRLCDRARTASHPDGRGVRADAMSEGGISNVLLQAREPCWLRRRRSAVSNCPNDAKLERQ